MNNEAYSGTQAVQRAVAVLQSFGPGAAPLTPQEISRRTGLNRSTIYRLLSALESAGFVVADDGRYRLGPELIALGGLALRQTDLRAAALPALRELARRTGETIDLEVLRGGEVVIVEEVAGDHLLSTASNVGTRYPAHCTATGKVLLARLPPARLDEFLAAPLSVCGPRTLTGPALRAALEQALTRGYAASYEELEAHLHAIGAPVFDHDGQVIAAVSISGPAARLPQRSEAQLAELLIGCCSEISRMLGYRGEGSS